MRPMEDLLDWLFQDQPKEGFLYVLTWQTETEIIVRTVPEPFEAAVEAARKIIEFGWYISRTRRNLWGWAYWDIPNQISNSNGNETAYLTFEKEEILEAMP